MSGIPSVVKGVAAGAGTALLTVLPKVIEVATDAAEKIRIEKEKHYKDWKKVPFVIGADLADAQSTLKQVGLNCNAIPLEPNSKYQNHTANIVLKVSHRAEKLVNPTTTITLFYLTQARIDQSRQLFIDEESKKLQAKEARQRKLVSMQDQAKEAMKKLPKTREKANQEESDTQNQITI